MEKKIKNTGYFLVVGQDDYVSRVIIGTRIRKPEKYISQCFPNFKSFTMVGKEEFFVDGLNGFTIL